MDQIAQIKQNLDVVSVVGGYVALKKSGKNYKGLCPFHSENTPSFMVSPELQIYKCFGCGEAGDIFQFIQKVDGVDFPTALQSLADKAGIKLEKQRIDPEAHLKKQIAEVNEMAGRFYNYLLTKHSLGHPGLEYFKKKRGLTDETIRVFGLGYAPNLPDALFKFLGKKDYSLDLLLKAGLVINKDGHLTDKFRGRVMFPLKGVDGKILGFTGRTIFNYDPKYLNTAETPLYHKSLVVFALDVTKLAIKKTGAILVEGQMDAIAAHQHGISNVIAASGTALTLGQLKLISRYTNELTFCFDSDTAGVGAAFRGIELAENMGFDIKVAPIPQGYKDLDEVLQKSPDLVQTMFSSAVPAYDFLMYSIIKKCGKVSPEGKKKVMDNIIPWFSRIKSKVLLDHYSKELAQELNLNVETVLEAIAMGETSDTVVRESEDRVDTDNLLPQQSVESYIIILLLKGPLDFMRSMGYKVEPQEFTDENLSRLIENLQNYLKEDLTIFDPKHFAKTINNADLAALFENLYLQETNFDVEFDISRLEKEFENSLVRFKKESAKRQMQKISKEMRLAEKSNDTDSVKKLTAAFEDLKSQLL